MFRASENPHSGTARKTMLVDADIPSASENPRLGTARMTMIVEDPHLGTVMPLVDAEVSRASENPHFGTARKTLNTLVPAMPMCDAAVPVPATPMCDDALPCESEHTPMCPARKPAMLTRSTESKTQVPSPSVASNVMNNDRCRCLDTEGDNSSPAYYSPLRSCTNRKKGDA